ncbi:MAG: RNA polymerase sigma factor [Kofleriaceae bacterium]
MNVARISIHQIVDARDERTACRVSEAVLHLVPELVLVALRQLIECRVVVLGAFLDAAAGQRVAVISPLARVGNRVARTPTSDRNKEENQVSHGCSFPAVEMTERSSQSSREMFFGNVSRAVRPIDEGNLTTRSSTCQPDLAMEPQVVASDAAASRPLAAVIASAKPALVLLAGRLCGSASDANDLVQDTLERAARQGIPADIRNPRAWLSTIMHNLFIDRCRSAQRQPVHESLDESHGDAVTSIDATEEPTWGRVTIDDVRAALDQLEPTFANVYRMHAFEHRSYEQIASQLKIERVTVGTRLNRARKMLRQVLVKRLGLEEAV